MSHLTGGRYGAAIARRRCHLQSVCSYLPFDSSSALKFLAPASFEVKAVCPLVFPVCPPVYRLCQRRRRRRPSSRRDPFECSFATASLQARLPAAACRSQLALPSELAFREEPHFGRTCRARAPRAVQAHRLTATAARAARSAPLSAASAAFSWRRRTTSISSSAACAMRRSRDRAAEARFLTAREGPPSDGGSFPSLGRPRRRRRGGVTPATGSATHASAARASTSSASRGSRVESLLGAAVRQQPQGVCFRQTHSGSVAALGARRRDSRLRSVRSMRL